LLVIGPIAWCVRLSIQPGRERFRAPLAAAAGGMVAFAVAAGVDWAWELAVLPVAFFALVAAVLGPELATAGRAPGGASGSGPADPPPAEGQPLKPGYRIAAVAGSLLAIIVIAVPMLGTQAYESSQRLVRDGDLEGALDRAEKSADLQPWAASPLIQEVQVLELLGRHREAADIAREAIEREEGNWRNWLVYSQVLARFSPAESAAALDRARALNSKSTLPELRAPASDGG
jgi:tetratricopeptide (TPR) repeat protein